MTARGGRAAAAAPIASLASLACLAVLAFGAMAPSASAKRPILRGITEDLQRSTNDSVREHSFDQAKRVGADLVSLSLHWRSVAAAGPPANPRDPSDPAYSWGTIDAAVRDARSHGFPVVLVVHDAPDWAEGPDRPDWAVPGTWKPDPDALEAFGEALGRRYSGHYETLPNVKYFEVWNEPNYAGFLAPQYENGQPVAPELYRRLLNHFYTGLKRWNPGGKVLGPGTLPFGQPFGVETGIRPRAFIRQVICHDRHNKPVPNCGPAKLDILSHHPMNPASSPEAGTAHRDDVTVSTMWRLFRTLRAAERAGTVTGGRHPVWVSELWWFTRSPPGSGIHFRTPPKEQARYLEESLYLLWRQGVSAMIWYQLTDDTGFPSGLIRSNGKKKPSYTAYKFPFVGDRRSDSKVTIWGIAPRSGEVRVQRKTDRGWRTVKTVRAKQDKPFGGQLRLRGPAKLRAKAGGEKSLAWAQSG
jgi:hypothetical protein